jgi:type I restriction-modification system DNA methylase subunit
MTTEEAIKSGKIDLTKVTGATKKLYTKIAANTEHFTNIPTKQLTAFKTLVKSIEQNFPDTVMEDVFAEELVDPLPVVNDQSLAAQYAKNRQVEDILLDLQNNDRQPTENELHELRLFSGYGSMEKMGATGKGLLYEYYTPVQVIRKMWELAYLHGYDGGDVCEPSVGPGRFLEFAPKNAKIVAYETNPTSAKICTLLYPQVEMHLEPFEKRFIENNNTVGKKVSDEKFSLVIGNPPYGEMGGIYAGMGEKKYTHAQNYIDYFLTRGLDILLPGGLLIMVIGAEVATGGRPFLSQESYGKVKEVIAEKGELLDAYRLPNGIFDRTDVVTDIVVFKRK